MEAAQGAAAGEHQGGAPEGVPRVAQERGLLRERQVVAPGDQPQRALHLLDEILDQLRHLGAGLVQRPACAATANGNVSARAAQQVRSSPVCSYPLQSRMSSFSSAEQ